MKRFVTVTALTLLIGGLVVTPSLAKKGYAKVKGEVVKVEQHVRNANGGEFDRLTIRTRQGREMQLNLGRGGACEGCFQQGDRIRARISADGSGGQQSVQSMKVRRGGEMYGFTNAGGKVVKSWSNGAGGAGGGGDRARDRIHEPGSGDCPGCGAGRPGGAGQGSGGGRGGGRGGG